ncbi:MAG: hypothetical protein NTV88_00760 [Candidatus Micrarchaeota archaeon]|nr:hypothetical protein [Candidatus Micrarchaeota archaeon]
MAVVQISTPPALMGKVISILSDIKSGNGCCAARCMIENAIPLAQIKKNYAVRYNGEKLPEKFLKAHSEEYWRAFQTYKETPMPYDSAY